MAATVQDAADGIVTRLQTIHGLRAYSDIPENITPPLAVVVLDSVPTFHDALQGGLPTYQFRVQLIVDTLSSRLAFKALNAYASYSGADSIRAAIEGDTSLSSTVQTCVVTNVENIGEARFGEGSTSVRYLAADFLVTVYA